MPGQTTTPACLACLAACHAAGDEAKGCGLFAAVDLVTHLQIAKIYTRSLQTHAYAYRAKHTKGRSERKGGWEQRETVAAINVDKLVRGGAALKNANGSSHFSVKERGRKREKHREREGKGDSERETARCRAREKKKGMCHSRIRKLQQEPFMRLISDACTCECVHPCVSVRASVRVCVSACGLPHADDRLRVRLLHFRINLFRQRCQEIEQQL